MCCKKISFGGEMSEKALAICEKICLNNNRILKNTGRARKYELE